MADTRAWDVVITGGGPSGATLAALLRRKPGLRVVVVEEKVFPREHIGESLVHLLIPVLRDSGALEKLLASDCWIQKFGGIYAWEKDRPAITRFDHLEYKRDGVPRWSVHVDRAEFDQILLEHAASLGAEVIQGVSVKAFESDGRGGVAVLSDGRRLETRLMVDASGRQSAKNLAGRHEHLSEFRNLAVWNHFTGCKVAQEIGADWNFFYGTGQSPIASFAYEHGWVWYIPVPKIVDGTRVMTHSIGIVTDPEHMRTGRDLTNAEEFVRELREVPLLRDLIGEAKMLRQKMNVASNYSMICEKFCDYDKRWIAVGDAAYFVDPLFSSGVTFATGMAGSACALIRGTLSSSASDDQKRELWGDYTREWKGIAQSFGLAIDQWYHAIAEQNPSSVYWKRRSGHSKGLGIRHATFQALVDTAITPDLMEVLTHGSHAVTDLSEGGAFLKTLRDIRETEPDSDSEVFLGDTRVVDGMTIDAPGFKAAVPPVDPPPELRDRISEFWRDPIANNDVLPCPYDAPMECKRFVRNGMEGQGVRFIEERGENGLALYELLKSKPGCSYGDLRNSVDPAQRRLLRKLCIAGLVDIVEGNRPGVAASGVARPEVSA